MARRWALMRSGGTPAASASATRWAAMVASTIICSPMAPSTSVVTSLANRALNARSLARSLPWISASVSSAWRFVQVSTAAEASTANSSNLFTIRCFLSRPVPVYSPSCPGLSGKCDQDLGGLPGERHDDLAARQPEIESLRVPAIAHLELRGKTFRVPGGRDPMRPHLELRAAGSWNLERGAPQLAKRRDLSTGRPLVSVASGIMEPHVRQRRPPSGDDGKCRSLPLPLVEPNLDDDPRRVGPPARRHDGDHQRHGRHEQGTRARHGILPDDEAVDQQDRHVDHVNAPEDERVPEEPEDDAGDDLTLLAAGRQQENRNEAGEDGARQHAEKPQHQRKRVPPGREKASAQQEREGDGSDRKQEAASIAQEACPRAWGRGGCPRGGGDTRERLDVPDVLIRHHERRRHPQIHALAGGDEDVEAQRGAEPVPPRNLLEHARDIPMPGYRRVLLPGKRTQLKIQSKTSLISVETEVGESDEGTGRGRSSALEDELPLAGQDHDGVGAGGDPLTGNVEGADHAAQRRQDRKSTR